MVVAVLAVCAAIVVRFPAAFGAGEPRPSPEEVRPLSLEPLVHEADPGERIVHRAAQGHRP